MDVMNRLVLGDAAWQRIAPLLIGWPGQKGPTIKQLEALEERLSYLCKMRLMDRQTSPPQAPENTPQIAGESASATTAPRPEKRS